MIQYAFAVETFLIQSIVQMKRIFRVEFEVRHGKILKWGAILRRVIDLYVHETSRFGGSACLVHSYERNALQQSNSHSALQYRNFKHS
jgi:hypothetical protein